MQDHLCQHNYIDMRFVYVSKQDDYVNKSHVYIIISLVDIVMFHVDKNKSQACEHILVAYTCWRQKSE